MSDIILNADETHLSGFASLGLHAQISQTLRTLGYEEPTPIQKASIPLLLTGVDMVGQAATGTGKTAAFSLPLIHSIAEAGGKKGPPKALVLAPTRELAMQVAEAIHKYGRSLGVNVIPIYGGQSYDIQIRALTRGVDVVVATPGRAIDHLERGTLKLHQVRHVVLDEADEMLDMGFLDDIETILEHLPAERQTVMFSATLPPRIAEMTRRYLKDPQEIRIAKAPMKANETPRVKQQAFIVARSQKTAALGRYLDCEGPQAALIFCRTRTEVDELNDVLTSRGYKTEALHGGMSQAQRERVIKKLKLQQADLVIATDVAARGLDIDHLTHVINYDVPSDTESYVHRVGRVGRAGREGIAVSLVEPREQRLLRNFEHGTKQNIEVRPLPTLADLKAHKINQTKSELESILEAGELQAFEELVQDLSSQHDLMAIALAAVKLATAERMPKANEPEIISPPQRGRERERDFRTEREPYKGARTRGSEKAQAGMGRIFIGAGREAGIKPQDIVGAIAGEAGISGRDIGAIDIRERHSLVDVVEEHVKLVISSLSQAKIKGRKVTVRPDRAPQGMKQTRG